MLSLLGILVMSQDLLAEVKYGKGAWHSSTSADGNDSKVPNNHVSSCFICGSLGDVTSHDHCNKAKASCYLEVVGCVFKTCFGGIETKLIVSSSDEGKEEDKTEEDDYEWYVCAK